MEKDGNKCLSNASYSAQGRGGDHYVIEQLEKLNSL